MTNRTEKPANFKSPSGLTAVLQSIGARMLLVLLNATTGIISARALHPAGRGELAALGLWPSFLGAMITLGLPTALIYHTRKDTESGGELLAAAMPVTMFLSLMGALAGVLFMPFSLKQYPHEVVFMAQIFMVTTPIVAVLAITRAACEARGDFFASSASLAINPLISIVVLVGVQVTVGLTPVSAAWAYASGGLPTCIWLMIRLGVPRLKRATSWVASVRRLISYGLRSYGVDICGTLSLYADQALVIRLLDPTSMGTYVVALSLSRMLNLIHVAVASVLFPKAVALAPADLIATTGRAARTSTSFTLLAGTALAFLGPLALSLLYGREYRGAAVILNLLIAEVVITGCTLVLTQAFMALDRPGVVTILQSSGLVFSIPLLIILVPRFGVIGASCALLTSSVVRLLLTLISFPLILKLRPPSLLPSAHDLSLLVPPIRDAVRRYLRPGSGLPVAEASVAESR